MNTTHRTMIVVGFSLFSLTAIAAADVSSYLANNPTRWEIRVDSTASRLAPVGDDLVFSVPAATNPNGGDREQSLYRTSGTETKLLGNIGGFAEDFVVAGNRAFYLDRARSFVGSNIYSTDGSTIDSVAVGPLSFWDGDIPIRSFIVPYGNDLLFRSHTSDDGWQVRQTDGLSIRDFDFPETDKAVSLPMFSPEPIEDIPILPIVFGQIGSRVLVGAETKLRDCAEDDFRCSERERVLYALNSTGSQPLLSGTEMLHSANQFIDFAGEKYFFATSEAGERGLFRTDGQMTQRIGQFRRERENVWTTEDRMYFMAEYVGTSRKSLFSTDGADLIDYGFEMLNGNQAEILAELNGEVYFYGWRVGENRSGVYRTDGDATRFLFPAKEFFISSTDQVAVYNGEVYFPAETGLAKSNGDEVTLIETNGGKRLDRTPFPLGVSGGSLFFAAEGPDDIGMEILKITDDEMEWIDIDPHGSGVLHRFGMSEFNEDIFFQASTRDRPTYVIDNGEVRELGDVETFVYDDVLYLADYSQPDSTQIAMVDLETTTQQFLPADFDEDGTVDLADFLVLSKAYGSSVDPAGSDPDIDGSGIVDFADFLVLSRTFGQSAGPAVLVPEPTTAVLLGISFLGSVFVRRKRSEGRRFE